MPSTPFLIASLTGQTPNADLSTYVPQSGDLNAAFTRAAGNATTTSLVFRDPTGVKSVATASGTVDIRYTAGQAITSTEGIDVALDFSTGAAVLPGGQVGGFTIGDDGGTSRVNVFVNWTSATPSLSVQNIVAGTQTNIVNNAGFPSGAAFALNTAYTLSIDVRGSAGAYTANFYLAPRGGTRVRVGSANFSIPSLVLAGRKVGLRVATFSVTNPGSDTNGIIYERLTASDYSASGTPTPSDSTPSAFAFTDVTNAARSTLIESDAVTISGIDVAAPVSITGGEYQVAGGAWASAAGTITNGQSVKVRLTSSASYSTIANATLTIGGVSDTFSVTTLADPGTSTPTPMPSPTVEIATVPGSLALRQGQSLTLSVTTLASGDYSGTLALSCTGLPAGVTASFSPASITGSGSSTLTLTAAGNAVTGAFEVLVSGTDGSITRTAPVFLQVNPPSGVVYPVVSDVRDDDLVTITRDGSTEQVVASALKAYLAS